MTKGTQRSARLDHVVEALEEPVVSVVAAPERGFAEVAAVVLHDPDDAADWPPGSLLLAVGVREPAEVASLVRQGGAHDLPGIVVKAPARIDEEVRAAVADSDVAVLELAQDASWTRLSDTLRALLTSGRLATKDTRLGGLAAGDLFGLADAIGALLNASVSLEDRSSRVLAWSSHQEEVDPVRIDGIVGRQAPQWLTRMLDAQGVFDTVEASSEPVYVEAPSPEMLPRMATAVRAGSEVLGYLWAAVREPFSAERTREFTEIAHVVAIHLLHHRARLDSHGTLRGDLAASVLHGGDQAWDRAARLGFASGKLSVLAAQVVGAIDDTALRRAADSFAVHLAAVHARAATTVIDDVVYGLLPWPVAMPVSEARARSVQLASDFAERLGQRSGVVIAVGGPADGLDHVVHARTEADQVLRVLRECPGARPVASLTEVQLLSLLLRLSDLVQADRRCLTGPVATLFQHDAAQRTQFTASLRAYLDAFGDTTAAASCVHVHANTFRYRLRRLCEISGLDLTDPDARLQAQLHLRLLDLVDEPF